MSPLLSLLFLLLCGVWYSAAQSPGSGGSSCQSGTECFSGMCGNNQVCCGQDWIRCRNDCINVQTDDMHCGDCDSVCFVGTRCLAGRCV